MAMITLLQLNKSLAKNVSSLFLLSNINLRSMSLMHAVVS